MLPVRMPHRELFGGVAQLGERTVRIRKVVGSIPIRSTKKPAPRWLNSDKELIYLSTVS